MHRNEAVKITKRFFMIDRCGPRLGGRKPCQCPGAQRTESRSTASFARKAGFRAVVPTAKRTANAQLAVSGQATIGIGEGGASDRSAKVTSPECKQKKSLLCGFFNKSRFDKANNSDFLSSLTLAGAFSSFCCSSEIFLHIMHGDTPLKVRWMASVIGAFSE